MKRLILFSSILLFFTHTFAQDIDSTIEKYADDYGEEKTYLHFDKSNYVPGETIWFKAYIMNGIFPADGSKNFYVDWSDEKGKLLSHDVFPVVYATSSGQFGIPENYSGKYIHVRAYTKWMLNFDTAFLYNKDIRILSRATGTVTKSAIIPSIQFFPEGGDAVEGVTNKIAFKANDQYGRPVNVKGIITDNHGAKIDSIKVIHDGMGYFFITPKAGETFSAKWYMSAPGEKDEKGTEHITPLPAARKNGISLAITLEEGKRIFLVSAPPQSAAALGDIHLIGTMNQHEVFKLTKDISQGPIRGIIPVDNLPTGILTVTVFNSQWMPLAERITFINNEDYSFRAEMSVEHWGLNKRAKDQIMITVPDSIAADFSVAVTDLNIDADSSDNIISHLLLTGDLRGYVYNPYYYFSNNSDTLSRQLDLVMLTHGWRRFKWEDVVAGIFPKIIYKRDTSYLTLSGKIYGALPSQLRSTGNLIFILKHKKDPNQMAVVQIQPNGTFDDPTLILFDTTSVFYHLPQDKLGDATVQFLQNRLPPFPNNIAASGIYYNQMFDTSGNARHLQIAMEEKELANMNKAKVLETVTVQARTKSRLELMDEKYTSGLFTGGDAKDFDLTNDVTANSMPDIFTYLQGRVAGLQITIPGGGTPSLMWRGGTPQLFLDEMPIDASTLQSTPVSNIAYVKVFDPPFFGGTGGGANGAIAVYTRRGDEAKSSPEKTVSSNLVTGYTPEREFYSPDYDKVNEDDDKKDLRTTLYWAPRVLTDHDHNKVLLTFYNNDISQAFRVVVEGMSNDGRLIHLENVME
ncbi:MAG TPA: hypothetical protein VG847_15650 [Chitinophagaceae bacterium]|nr:hypothetical protein [Chitinophagaceae bacterium]